ncbi:hypothetical protein BDZ45DRAFT_94978 [Acephala macrosclerotiorum]|nr:hypothetical protein BDZ45DRAFT_94978 [Acephala macrosclerotiorum]
MASCSILPEPAIEANATDGESKLHPCLRRELLVQSLWLRPRHATSDLGHTCTRTGRITLWCQSPSLPEQERVRLPSRRDQRIHWSRDRSLALACDSGAVRRIGGAHPVRPRKEQGSRDEANQMCECEKPVVDQLAYRILATASSSSRNIAHPDVNPIRAPRNTIGHTPNYGRAWPGQPQPRCSSCICRSYL